MFIKQTYPIRFSTGTDMNIIRKCVGMRSVAFFCISTVFSLLIKKKPIPFCVPRTCFLFTVVSKEVLIIVFIPVLY